MFINALFPSDSLRLIHDFEKSISSPTTIVGNGNKEYRIKKTKNYISSWKYPSRLLSSVDRKVIAKFMADVAEFGFKSFKFKDPDLNQYNLTSLTYAGSNNFYLTTLGIDSTHPVFHLGADIVVRQGATTVAFTQVIVDGKPAINIPGVTSNVNISGTFYHCARFEHNSLSWTLAVLNPDNSSYGDNLSDINLIEVFEY